ncbi:hypothetical protein KKG05_10890 [bacterium]|nr:hypothetical protein [bacterium]
MNISDDDREILELFCRKAKEISNTSIFREKKYNTSIKLNWKEGKGLNFSLKIPDREPFVHLVTILRQFYAPSESVNFSKVYNIVWKYLDNKEARIREYAVSAKAIYKEILAKTKAPILFNNHRFAPREIIDLWFNADIFHTDQVKRKKLEAILQLPIAPFLIFEFATAMMELANIIIYFGGLVETEILSVAHMEIQ